MSEVVKLDSQQAPRPPPIAVGINVEKPNVYSKPLESFEAWPECIPVDNIDLVDEGLVYTGVGDSVRCYFCGGGLRNWERGDVPMEEHARWYPKCPHTLLVKGQTYIEKLSQRGDKPEVDGNTSSGHNDSSTATDIINSAAAQNCIQMGYKDNMVQKAIDIYTKTYGVGDSVRCYFCGGGLRNWERGDVPMEEHAKWYPKCPHILLVKGQAYVEKLSRGEKPEVDGVTRLQDKSTTANLIDSMAAQSCIQIGYTDKMVQKAINIYTNKYGNSDFKGKELCEIIFELEENPDASFTETGRDDKNQIAQLESNAPNEDIEPLETLLEENQKLKENQMCKICLDSRADIIFLPCGHMVSCPQCAPALTKCPVCRKTVNGHIKAVFAMTNIS